MALAATLATPARATPQDPPMCGVRRCLPAVFVIPGVLHLVNNLTREASGCMTYSNALQQLCSPVAGRPFGSLPR
eukprot:11198237-Lingulodinium_polyedra.AAC.1